MTQLCKTCILPVNYSGISFDNKGICNFCNNYKPIRYLGEEKLKEDIAKLRTSDSNNNYDCVVSFSGGRDSTFLLWYVVNILKLNPLAVFVNSQLIPQQTLSNINKTAKKLGVQLIIKEHDYLKNCITHFLKSWMKYPDPSTLITLCTGCRLGFTKHVFQEAKTRKIPIIFAGGTPFEKGFFKRNLISNSKINSFSFIKEFGKQVIKNPILISRPNCSRILAEEYFRVPKLWSTKKRNGKPIKIEPFIKYFRWEKDKIERILKNELDWKRYPGLQSSYRGDCEVGIIRQFYYNKMLGYNDKDDHLSWLVRDKQISRNEAMKKVNTEKETSLDILKSSFEKLGLDFTSFNAAVEKNAQKHNIRFV